MTNSAAGLPCVKCSQTRNDGYITYSKDFIWRYYVRDIIPYHLLSSSVSHASLTFVSWYYHLVDFLAWDTELLSRWYGKISRTCAMWSDKRVIQDCITCLFNQSPLSIYVDQMIDVDTQWWWHYYLKWSTVDNKQSFLVWPWIKLDWKL